MSDDGFTETTTRSWLSRLGGALAGALLGLVLLLAAGWLLWWNEGRAVTTARSLAEGAGLVMPVPPAPVNPAHEGRLIHVAGPVRTTGPARDEALGVAAPSGAVRLQRRVEMFQWREEQRSETRTRLGGGTETVTTYSYTRGWAEGRIESERFRRPEGHENPNPRHASRSFAAPGVTVGAFRLSDAQAARVPAAEPVGEPRFLGEDPDNPRVGDLRVTWQAARPAALSVVAAQAGDGFAPFATAAGDRLFLLADGLVSPAGMFRTAERENVLLTWAIRGGGALTLFVGFALVLAPLRVAADVIPPLGAVVGFGLGFLALALALVAAPVIIALAWLAVRPWLALGVGAAGLALAAWVVRRRARALRPLPA